MIVTKTMVEFAYRLLVQCPEFQNGVMPTASLVTFVIRPLRKHSGLHTNKKRHCEVRGYHHTITIDPQHNDNLLTLLETMAHEMVHIWQIENAPKTWGHGPLFNAKIDALEKETGLDLDHYPKHQTED